MDKMSRAVDEDLLKELECPVCMEYMVPPIQLCTNGHNTCSRCKEIVKWCPTCRASFSETRNVTLENIVRIQKYPCANRQSGCLEWFSIEHIAKHHAGCVFGKIKCPFHLISNCSWNGFKNDLKEHAKAAHLPGLVMYVPKFHAPRLSTTVAIVSYFGELFTFHKKKKDGRYYAAVQLIGTNIEASKYKCEFTLRAANDIDQISNTFLVQGYSEDFETIFNSGKCLKLDADTVKHFVEGDELKLTVTLYTV
jgi:E3 ubiquitin-protein ligase SIAH1